ncbi:MAG: hypothetical protein RLZZ597_1618 [Cyanobacteriota bacterium]|jgi:hypothetical protein
MHDELIILNEEDVIDQQRDSSLIPHVLNMSKTFKVEELKQDIRDYLRHVWDQSFSGKVLRHNHPGWQSGEIKIKFSVEIEFQPDTTEKTDSQDPQDPLEELRSLN